MTQPTLFNTNERPKHRPVRETSRTAYQVGKAKWTGRKKAVEDMLDVYQANHLIHPTSAELARWSLSEYEQTLQDYTSTLLFVRRGLSDLAAVGAVENPKGVDGKLLKRPCAVTGSMCYVWRIRTR